ncbi:SETD3 [Symbiodinium sp. KB8]|nr:SETD3 [Symbiodinium sp. KB8]
MAAADESRAMIEAFCKWCQEQSCEMSRVRIEQTSSGLGLLAAQDIKAGEIGLSVPIDALLTVAAAAKTEIGQTVLSSAAARNRGVSAQALMYIVMLDGWHNPASRWHSYLRLIPATHNDPLWWTDSERQERLAGTQLFHEAARHMAQLRDVYDSLFPALSQQLPSVFPAERYTFQAFLWARSSLSSRCFSNKQLSTWLHSDGHELPELPALETEEKSLVNDCPAALCPLLDITNHNPDVEVHVGLVRSAGTIHLGISATSAVATGCEFFNNYGSCRTNLQLLLAHGFAVPKNSADTLPVKIRSDDSTRPELQRKALELAGLNTAEVHELSLSDLLPVKLLALLRILCMSLDCLDMYYVKEGAALLQKLQSPVPVEYCDRCEMQVLSTLEGQLLNQKSRIRPADMSAASAPERHAAVYRAGQLEIISEALKEIQRRRKHFCGENGLLEESEEEEGAEVDPEEEEPEEEKWPRPAGVKRRRIL